MRLHLPGYTIHPVTDADVPALQRLLEADPAYSLIVDGVVPGPNAAREMLDEELPPGFPPERRHMYLVECDDRPAAIVELLDGFPEPDIWYLGFLFVAPWERNNGLGRKLLAAIYAHVAAKGGRAVRLGVMDANVDARRLYDREGFAFVKSATRPFRDGRPASLSVLQRAV